MAKKPSPQNKPPVGRQQQQLQIHNLTHQSFEGPIPPPAALQQYEAIVPGAAERILAMAEEESRHRRQQEAIANQANVDAQKRQLQIAEQQTKSVFQSDAAGQLFGFIVSAGCVSGSIFLAYINQPWVASVLAGLPLAGIIRALRERQKPK
jgi:uncharacterized membrane protein